MSAISAWYGPRAMKRKPPATSTVLNISQNGGWTGDPNKEKPGRDLGYPRLDKFGEAFGGHGEYVTKPDDIRPALERAKKAVVEGKSALVCVVTDHNARATTAAFTNYST